MNQVTDGDIRRTPQFAEYAKKFPELAKFIPHDITFKEDVGSKDSKHGSAERSDIASKDPSRSRKVTFKEDVGRKYSKHRGAERK